jgi:UDP-glucuronate 4-epimerase
MPRNHRGGDSKRRLNVGRWAFILTLAMKKCVVTGAAGFIGSHLCESLLADGINVVGIDAFIPYYPADVKRKNLQPALEHSRFEFQELDLRTDSLDAALDGADTVIHLAAMPGLRRSWSEFELYSSCNINGTQRLLDAVHHSSVEHFICGSTSSVYGKEAVGQESAELAPASPYGLTKLAAENLCRAYEMNFGLPVTVLRLFSVYGPRQRPDMAYTILIDCLLHSKPFTRLGTGEQTRSNTFVTDCVQGIRLAAAKPDRSIGETFNIGGGEVVSLNEVITILESLTSSKLSINPGPLCPGDQLHTRANIDKAMDLLGYLPSTAVREGLAAQLEWRGAVSAI